MNGDRGDSQLTATSLTGTGAPGTVFPGLGDGGVDAMAGTSGGDGDDTGSYLVSDVSVAVIKSATVADPFGGIQPVPGATITYSVAVAVTGSGTAASIVITDPMPANTTYVPGSIALNAAPLTDAADADAAQFAANQVTVSLGDIAGGSPTDTITFDVTID